MASLTFLLLLLAAIVVPDLLGGDTVEPAAFQARPIDPEARAVEPTPVGGSASLLFEAGPSGKRDLYVLDVEAGGESWVRLTEHPANDHAAVWSPDGARVAFLSDRTGRDEVYVVNADGAGLMQLTDNPEFQWWPPLSWSPDGAQLVATRMPATRVHISVGQIMRLDIARGTTALLTPETNGQNPLWSPAGDRFVYERRDGDLSYLSIIGLGGASIADIEVADYLFGRAWSPTGDALAYLTRQGIEQIDASGVPSTSLLAEPLPYNGVRHLSWSPDGAYLVFVADVENNGCWLLHLVQLQSSAVRRLEEPCYAMRTTPPSWSPDGRWLAFSGPAGITLLDVWASWEDPEEPAAVGVEGNLESPLNPQWRPRSG